MDEDKTPQTSDEYDRLVLSSPNSSLVWIRYMAFYLQSAEIDKARAVAERALKTMSFRSVSLLAKKEEESLGFKSYQNFL